MARRRSIDDKSPRANWLLTYGCLVTQLLVFFVMLFALSSTTTLTQLKSIKKRVDGYVAENKLQDRIRTDMSQKEKGLVISLGDKLMFESGKAELASEEARQHIAAIMKLVQSDTSGRAYPNRVTVEGHTDNVPLRPGAAFATNWELSAARATNIARFLVEELGFEPKRLSSSGYAEWWPAYENMKDIAEPDRLKMPPSELVARANDAPEKQGRNRRVDIVVRRLELHEMQFWRDELMKAVSKAVGKK
ncbi:MAG: flagellar motor protein MotB [Elusimicrobia bacterium]|nr:flagellar motor protein MotB [Elusimicrobiota bacterium]